MTEWRKWIAYGAGAFWGSLAISIAYGVDWPLWVHIASPAILALLAIERAIICQMARRKT